MTERPAFAVVGAAQAGQLGQFNYGEIWEKQYMPMDALLKPFNIDGGYYGVTLGEEGHLVYLAGVAVEGLAELPPGAARRVVPAACYAVFDCTLSQIGATWQAAYGEWLPASDYVLDTEAVDFEYYPPPGDQGEQRVEIHIPIKPRKQAG
ncbi:MAG: GyrI-like domain-containing protein [Candidatus Latescibacterota bacterium]|jgi:predicted transcriptional regulator YdeE